MVMHGPCGLSTGIKLLSNTARVGNAASAAWGCWWRTAVGWSGLVAVKAMAPQRESEYAGSRVEEEGVLGGC